MTRRPDKEIEEKIKKLEEKIENLSKKTTLECADVEFQIKNLELRIDLLLWTLGRKPKYNTVV